MRNFLKAVYLFPLIILFCFAQCKKGRKPLNMTLYDKPLSVIRANIREKWQLRYGKGGIASNNVQQYNNCYFEFNVDDKIKIITDNIVFTDTLITWINEPGIYTNGTSTFTMNFNDKQGYPNVYIVDKIVNDTLVLHDYAVDAVYYYFTKI